MKSTMSLYVAAALCAATSIGYHTPSQANSFAAIDQAESLEKLALGGEQSKLASNAVNAKAVGEGGRDLVYTPIQPCRIVDTRVAIGPLAAGVIRNYFAALTTYGGQGGDSRDCGVPGNAAAVQANLVAIGPDTGGFLTVWQAGAGQPTASNLNYIATDAVRSNAATIPLAANTQFSVFTSRPVNLVVDVVGYFAPPTTAAGSGAFSWTGVPNFGNLASGVVSTVVGGANNVASGTYSTIVAGQDGRAGGDYSTVTGGVGNGAYGYGSTVSGGASNRAGNTASAANDPIYATVGGGGGNIATGGASMVPGGWQNSASGLGSFAAGWRAKATRDGQFTWADSKDFDFNPAAQGSFGGNPTNAFMVRATGGVAFYTGINNQTGALGPVCYILPNGSGWNCVSDRALKTNISNVSPKKVLRDLMSIPVSTWNMIGSDVRQIGPMSQDFFKAFGVGSDDRTINQTDAQGVAFAAIQGLYQELADERRSNQAKDVELKLLKRELSAIKKKLGL